MGASRVNEYHSFRAYGRKRRLLPETENGKPEKDGRLRLDGGYLNFYATTRKNPYFFTFLLKNVGKTLGDLPFGR